MVKLKYILSICFVFIGVQLSAQQSKSRTDIKKIELQFKGKWKKARKIIVKTEFPVSIDTFWHKELLVSNTEKVVKPLTNLNVQKAPNSPYFLEDSLYILKPLSFGFIPLGGKHYIFIEEINQDSFFIQTREYNVIAKIWDHKLSWQQVDNMTVEYTDSVELYAGWMTPLFAWYLKIFYTHRHKKWYGILVD